MDSPQDSTNEPNNELRREKTLDPCTSLASSGSRFRLFGHHRPMHQIMGGGKAADLMMWKRRHTSIGIIVIATAAWFLFEHSGLSFLSITSDVLLVLIVIQFVWSKIAVLLNKQLQPLPELILSEEMVHSAAACFRVKANYMLLIAHDITLGKDFKLFFKVVAFLWILSVIGSFLTFVTVAYIGILASVTLPALYDKYEEHLDKYAGLVHQKFSKHYKIVNENVKSRFPGKFSADKET